MIQSTVFTLLDSQHSGSYSEILPGGKRRVLKSLPHFVYIDPQKIVTHRERVPMPCCFLQALGAGVVAGAVSPRLCLVGIVIHLTFCTCRMAR